MYKVGNQALLSCPIVTWLHTAASGKPCRLWCFASFKFFCFPVRWQRWSWSTSWMSARPPWEWTITSPGTASTKTAPGYLSVRPRPASGVWLCHILMKAQDVNFHVEFTSSLLLYVTSIVLLQEDFPMSWPKVTSSVSSPSKFPSSGLSWDMYWQETMIRSSFFSHKHLQVWRGRQHKPGAWQEDREVQRLLLRLLWGPEKHHPGCGQLQWNQGEDARPITHDKQLTKSANHLDGCHRN